MPQKLSRSTKRKVEKVDSQASAMTDGVKRLIDSRERYTELFRRATIDTTIDGYPASSRMGYVSGSGSGSSPTEAAVNARENPQKDTVAGWAKRFSKLVTIAETAIEQALWGLDHMDQVVEEEKARPTTDPCPVCTVLPVEKRGFCRPCYNAWWDHGSPDRERWVLYKLKIKNSEGLVLVDLCPPPVAGKTARRGPWSKDADIDLTES